MTLNWPGVTTWITPPHMHIKLQVESTVGMLPIMTVGMPGTQGAVVAGTQAIGVNTPSAAAVALATVGLAMLEHMPNVGMLTMGMLSMTFAAGTPPAMTRLAGRTCNAAGATPKLHAIMLPLVTCRGIAVPIECFRNYIAYAGCPEEARTTLAGSKGAAPPVQGGRPTGRLRRLSARHKAMK
jgi:hypothetical protein